MIKTLSFCLSWGKNGHVLKKELQSLCHLQPFMSYAKHLYTKLTSVKVAISEIEWKTVDTVEATRKQIDFMTFCI